MKVIEYIKNNGLQSLSDDLGISVKEYDEGLIVLKYNQIDSPKNHPVVMECRGIILDKDLNIVCRPFDRFFNLGEGEDERQNIDWTTATVCEKLDGSLIKIYFWSGEWHCGTSGTAFAESNVGSWDMSFADLVEKAIDGDLNEWCVENSLDEDNTYLFELTSPYNRVVTPYTETKLTLLAIRDTPSGKYYQKDSWCATDVVKTYSFNNAQDAVQMANDLPAMEEGYVVYNTEGIPVMKIKNPSYVAIHHIRGENSLLPKNVARLVLENEQEEYLTYFPEDKKWFLPIEEALRDLLQQMEEVYAGVKGIESQKEYALSMKDYKFSSVLFDARKKKAGVEQAFNEMKENYKIDLLLSFVKE